MNAKKRIGIVGFGGICNGAHLVGYEECRDIAEITAVCDNDPAKLALAKEKLGLDDSRLFLDYNDLIASGLVDAIDICTPNDIHCKAAMAAVKAGLDFSIEKPVGLNFSEVKELYEAAEAKGTKTFVCLSYRYMAPMRYMRQIVSDGKIGAARHINITYYKDSGLWEGRRLEWRFDKKRAGTGVLGDLGVHLLDTVRFLGEEFDGLFAQTGITVKERQALESDEILPVTTDDWCYGGYGQIAHGAYPAQVDEEGASTVSLYLPARTAVVLKEGTRRKVEVKKPKAEAAVETEAAESAETAEQAE